MKNILNTIAKASVILTMVCFLGYLTTVKKIMIQEDSTVLYTASRAFIWDSNNKVYSVPTTLFHD